MLETRSDSAASVLRSSASLSAPCSAWASRSAATGLGVGRLVGDHDHLARAGGQVDADAARDEQLRGGDVRVPRADDAVDGRRSSRCRRRARRRPAPRRSRRSRRDRARGRRRGSHRRGSASRRRSAARRRRAPARRPSRATRAAGTSRSGRRCRPRRAAASGARRRCPAPPRPTCRPAAAPR